MNDIEYHRDLQAPARDLYLELRLIEERGNRLSSRRSMAASVLALLRRMAPRRARGSTTGGAYL